jgi:hypothetical protein
MVWLSFFIVSAGSFGLQGQNVTGRMRSTMKGQGGCRRLEELANET